MKKSILSLVFFMSLTLVANAQDWKGNGSLGFGLLNLKVRLQYEMPLNKQFTIGANSNIYFVNWKGLTIEPFARVYGKSGNSDGFFGQVKLGYGNLSVLDQELDYTYVLRWSTFGGGLGCGYKFLVGSHFTIEPYCGVRFYTSPNYESYSYTEDLGNVIGWFATTGLPVELNWKVGYQF